MVGLLSFGSQLAQSLNAGLDKRDADKKAAEAEAYQRQRQATQDAQQATNFANQQTTFKQQQERLPIEQARQDELTVYQLKTAKNKSEDDDRRAIGQQTLSTLYSFGANNEGATNTPEIDNAYVAFSKQNKAMTDAGWDIEPTGKAGVFKITDPSGAITEQTRTPQDMIRSVYGFIDPTKEFEDNRKLSRDAAKDQLTYDRQIEVAKIGAGSRLGVANVNAGASNYRADRGVDGRIVSANGFGRNTPVEGDVYGNPIGGGKYTSQTNGGGSSQVAQVDPNAVIEIGFGDKKAPLSVGRLIEAYPTMPQSSKDLVDEKFMQTYGTNVAGVVSGSQQQQPPSQQKIKPYVIPKAKTDGFKAKISSLDDSVQPKAKKAYGEITLAISDLSNSDPEVKQQAIGKARTGAYVLATLQAQKKEGQQSLEKNIDDAVDILTSLTGQSRANVRKVFFDGQLLPATKKAPTAAEAIKQRKVETVKNPVLSPATKTAQQVADQNLNQF